MKKIFLFCLFSLVFATEWASNACGIFSCCCECCLDEMDEGSKNWLKFIEWIIKEKYPFSSEDFEKIILTTDNFKQLLSDFNSDNNCNLRMEYDEGYRKLGDQGIIEYRPEGNVSSTSMEFVVYLKKAEHLIEGAKAFRELD